MLQSSSGTHVLTDIREGYTVDSFYNADWSPYTRDVYRPARPSPQTFPNSSYDYLVKWIGRWRPCYNSPLMSLGQLDSLHVAPAEHTLVKTLERAASITLTMAHWRWSRFQTTMSLQTTQSQARARQWLWSMKQGRTGRLLERGCS
jgi:hypothetical protein